MTRSESKALIKVAMMINTMLNEHDTGSEGYNTLEGLMDQLTMMANDADVELRNCILLAIAEEHSGDKAEGERIADSVFDAVKDLMV